MSKNTVVDFAKMSIKKCLIVKKGTKYLTLRNGELSLTIDRMKALIFLSEKEVKSFINQATIDTHNDSVINGRYDIVPLTKNK